MREKAWIRRHENLLNLTEGGEGLAGHSFSAEHRLKMRRPKDRSGVQLRSAIHGFEKAPRHTHGRLPFLLARVLRAITGGVPKAFRASAWERGVCSGGGKEGYDALKRGHALSGGKPVHHCRAVAGAEECRKIHKRNMEKARG